MNSKNKKTVAQVLADSLARHGVEVMFSQCLPSALLLAAEDIKIKHFMYRTENAGAYMADCYARITGKVGVVTAQNGPAATLLVPGLAEALKVSIPIVALVQDVNRHETDKNAFQEYDHLALFQGCTKWVKRVTEASRIEDYIDMAFTAAASGKPGPVVLMLPADLLLEEVTLPTPRVTNLGYFPLDRVMADPNKINEAATILAEAKNPVIIAGGGVHISGASKEVVALQENCHLPVMTTVMGKGAVDENHPLTIGVVGYALGKLSPGRYMKDLIDEADVILLVGSRTNQNGTDSWALYPKSARIIHVDMDSQEIGRNYEALRLNGDAKLTLIALCDALKGRREPMPDTAVRIKQAKAKHAPEIARYEQSNADPIRPERLAADIRKVLTPDTIVVADASYSTLWVACYLPALKAGMRFITPRGLAGLGWGFPMAIGAKVAKPKSPVICMVGDGGFAHVWSELETASRQGTPVVLTVLNNGCLGYQKDAEDTKFTRHSEKCYFAPVDHAKIAEASGCRGVRIEKAEDYLPALKEALASDVTTLLDVVTDPEAYPPITFFDGLDDFRDARQAQQS
ncbi:MAG: acetolactate synthase catalytic subunit [Hyphomicrobiales bacterium]|nr:acetolactate synthase catalytic subunit [Hyphomicrobiales bacterium]